MPSQPPPPLADRCLAFLDRQEAVLRRSRAVLADLHAALRRNDPAAAAAALAAASDLEAETAEAAGGGRGLAADPRSRPNLSDLIARLSPADSARVRARRRDVRALAGEVDRLRRRCGDLLAYCRVYLLRLLTELQPAQAGGPRYGPTGERVRSDRCSPTRSG
jgi:hypothetical protein